MVNALSQNAGQAQGVQTSAAIAALKAAIDGENQSILELLSGTVEPGAPGSQLNVYA